MRHRILVSLLVASVALVGVGLVVAGCQQDQAMAPAAASGERLANVRCPMKGTPIDPANVPAGLRREHKGRTVAFCCGGCPAAWDKLSEAEKDAKLAAACATSRPAEHAGMVVNATCPMMGSKIDPANVPDELTCMHRGQTVGFCRERCRKGWDKLSEAEKDAKLRACMP